MTTAATAWIGSQVRLGKDIVITALPLYHIFALTANWMVFVKFGAHGILIANPRDFPAFVKELKKYPFSYFSGVNTLFNALLHTPGFDSVDFSNLRITLGGGMAVQRSVAEHWKKKSGQTVTVKQSHGGSGKQARAVIDGLEADVVTLALAYDVDQLASKGKLIPENWQIRLPSGSAPYTSTIVFVVRKGNPKGIKDWADVAKPGVAVVIPNPKLTGNGRYSYIAAYGAVLKAGGTPAQARERVQKIFANVPVFDGGGRAATTTFVQRNIGDALATFESEVDLIREEFGDVFDVVYPSWTVLADPAGNEFCVLRSLAPGETSY